MLSCCDLRASDILVGAPLEILVIGRRECISKLEGGSCNIFCFKKSSLFGKQIVTLVPHKKVRFFFRKCNKKRPFVSGAENNESLFKFLLLYSAVDDKLWSIRRVNFGSSLSRVLATMINSASVTLLPGLLTTSCYNSQWRGWDNDKEEEEEKNKEIIQTETLNPGWRG